MSCARLTPEYSANLSTNDDTFVQYRWFTDWITCAGLSNVRATIKRINADNSFSVRFAFQIAKVRTNDPGSPTVLAGDAYHSGNGESCTDDLDLSTYADDGFFVRFGVAYKLTEGSGYASADVYFQVAYGLKGSVIGKGSQQVLAPDSTYRYLLISDWVPALSAVKFQVAYVVSDASADFYTRLAYQTAATSIEEPGAWTTDGTEAGDDREVCEQVSISTSNKMWVRFAIAYKANSGSNLSAYVSGAIATIG
ncbi:MAG: hypothetical protein ABIO70_03525 [Pseudomonadota bacterium]